MSTSSGLIPCPQLQDQLDGHFQECGFDMAGESIPVTRFLISNLNTNGTLQRQVSPGAGKKREVELIYQQRIPESGVSDSVTRVCTSATKDAELSQVYSIPDDGVSIDRQIDTNDLIDHCADDAFWVAKQIQRWMNALTRKMETKIVADLIALRGRFAVGETDTDAGNDLKTIETQYSDGKMNENGLVDIAFAAMNAGYCKKPVLIGWNELWKYTQKYMAGCCSTSGVGLDQLYAAHNMLVLGSYRMANALNPGANPNHFLSLDPGAAQLLYFNEFVGPRGIREIDTENEKQYVLFDPETGIPFDYFAKHDCGKWHFQLKLAFKVDGLPVDIFSASDRLTGVTFVNEYRIVNP